MLTNPNIAKILQFFRLRKPNIANYNNLHTGLMLTNPNIAKKAYSSSKLENSHIAYCLISLPAQDQRKSHNCQFRILSSLSDPLLLIMQSGLIHRKDVAT